MIDQNQRNRKIIRGKGQKEEEKVNKEPATCCEKETGHALPLPKCPSGWLYGSCPVAIYRSNLQIH